jgi:hypothetical protein
MKMKKQIKLSIISLTIIVVGTFIYILFWGKFFPYSPIHIGFSKHELPRTIFYIQNGADFNEYQKIDSLPPLVEDAHQLKFLKKPKIFIFRDKKSYLQRSTTKARFCAYPNSSLIISPWALKEAEEGKISLEIYVRHELSHTILYQNMGILPAYIYFPRWLMEGIAMYTAQQRGTSFYPSKEETYRLVAQGNFLPPESYHTRKENQVRIDAPNRIAFIYSEFGCIVDYMFIRGGEEKFLSYMNALLHSNNHDQAFKNIYGVDFETFLINFKEHVQEDVEIEAKGELLIQ